MASKANQTIELWLEKLDNALKNKDSSAAAKLFASESYWRDFVSFTWNLKTMEGRDQIAEMIDATLQGVQPGNWRLQGDAS